MLLPKVPQSREEVSLAWIQEALKQAPFEVLSISWNGGVGDGVGFMSSLERLSLTILEPGHNNNQPRNLSLVLKIPPTTNSGLRQFVLSEGFCQREYQMYANMLPAWAKFQESRGTPAKHRFRHPHCYYAAEEGSGPDYKMVLLLEDMSTSGYSTSTHGFNKGLRWSQAKLVVEEMARFHAVGMAFKEAQGMKHYAGVEYDWLYTHSKDQSLLDTFLRSGINSTCDFLRKDSTTTTTSSIPSGLISDLESFSDVRRLQELSFPRNRAGTITHQDLHTHNIMLRGGDQNQNSSVAFIDFQGCSYASPMSDLTFFLLLCCDSVIYTRDLLLVLKTYAKAWSGAMRGMDSSLSYPIQEIAEDYHASLFVSIVHIILGSPNWCFNPSLTSADTQERFKSALIDSYQRCGGHLGLDTLEQFANYFDRQDKDDDDDQHTDDGDESSGSGTDSGIGSDHEPASSFCQNKKKRSFCSSRSIIAEE